LALNTYQGSIGSNERNSPAPKLGNADAFDPRTAEALHQPRVGVATVWLLLTASSEAVSRKHYRTPDENAAPKWLSHRDGEGMPHQETFIKSSFSYGS